MGMKTRLFCACLLFVFGCDQRVARPKNPAPVSTSQIEAAFIVSYADEADLVAIEMDEIAVKIDAGDLKYDKKLMDAIADAFDRSASKSTAPLAKAVADTLNDGGATVDPEKSKKAVKEMASAARKISEKLRPKIAQKSSQKKVKQ